MNPGEPCSFATRRPQNQVHEAEDIDTTNALIREARLRKVIERVYDAVSWSYIAKTYFGKSRSWLNQRLNGFMVKKHSLHKRN